MTALPVAVKDPSNRSVVAYVVVYSGSLGSWYNLDEMLSFFEVARRSLVGIRFLVLSPQAAQVRPIAERFGVGDAAIALSVRPEEVPAYLAAADAGVCFLQNVPSKAASSPTKYAEYLATGLPVVCDSWTGDNAGLASHPAFVCIGAFSERDYKEAATRLAALLASPDATRDSARRLAGEQFSIEIATERYHRLYRRVSGLQQ
jgi:glycosyltransferase involved in cell wall biosynthesis